VFSGRAEPGEMIYPGPTANSSSITLTNLGHSDPQIHTLFLPSSGFLARSSITGHLGCLCLLAIVNTAAMNVHVPLLSNVLDTYPEVGLLNYMVVLFLIF